MVASAAAILTASNGMRPPSDVEPDPRALLGFLEHIARVQTIKCSPRDRPAGQPTSAMWRQCPPRYLSGELAILRPRTLLVFGTGPWDAMNAIGEIALEVDESVFSYGTFTAGALNSDLFWLPHPNNHRGGWALGQQRLLDHLSQML
jgi:uracil-DNA glycosylase